MQDHRGVRAIMVRKAFLDHKACKENMGVKEYRAQPVM